ncbi:MAG: 3-phosphoshikimate 1-carboxyvinyltransferase [Pseudomonadota bacterium]
MSSKRTPQLVTVRPWADGRSRTLQSEILCPPDKSVTHRSVMLAAMAKGESEIVYPLMGADCRSTMAVFRALGVTIEGDGAGQSGTTLKVSSPGWDGWRSPLVPLDYGNSGTTARLLTGLFAATPGLFVTCFGDASLSTRPMGRVVTPLRAMGAKILGRDDGRLLPMAVYGQQLKGVDHTVDKATAQVKSALILAGLNCEGQTQVTLPSGSRDHTERMLAALGAKISVEKHGLNETVRVRGPFRPEARRHLVPGDPSSAAFFAVLAVQSGGTLVIKGVLDNDTRTGFIALLEQMGAKFDRRRLVDRPGYLEPVMDLVVHGSSELHAIETDPAAAPTFIDEVPILAVAAMFARGKSRLRGLGELRVKESDRLAKVVELLTIAGARVWTEGDDLFIEGPTEGVQPFVFDPAEDHRLAMAAAILAKFADGPCRIADPHCVAVSFPDFFEVLASLG